MGLRPRALTIVFILVFLVLLIVGMRMGELGENLFNGSVL